VSTARLQLTRRNGALIVALIAFAIYAPSFWNGFAYDDVALIPHDPRIKSLRNLLMVFTEPYWGGSGPELAIYRPLVTLSFMLDWVLSSGQATWFHITNAIWNSAACALGFLLLAELFALPAALFGALVFALHPVHVEAVANVVGRAEMIAAVFVFAACVAWVRRDRMDSRTATATVTALFALGLLAKESSAMLGPLLVLLDFATGRWSFDWRAASEPAGRTASEPARRSIAAYASREKTLVLAFTLVFAAYVAARFAVLGRFGPTAFDPVFEGLDGRGDRVLTALQAWPHYVRLAFFPRTLLADYGPRIVMPARGWTPAALLGATLLFTTAVGGVFAAVRGYRRTALALLWFLLTALPVSNLIVTIGIVVAERTLYMPLFSVAIAAAATAAALLAARSHRVELTGLTAGVALLAAFASRDILRIPEWDTTNSIFFALHRDRPDAFRAHWHMAREARVAGDIPESGRQYNEAVRLWPLREGLIAEAAGLAVMQHRLEDGRKLAAFGAERWPNNLAIQRLLAGTALDLGDTARALVAMRAGLRIDPRDDMLRRMQTVLTHSLKATTPNAR
jgi:hypothetical protein